MDKTILTLVVVAAFVVGSIATGTIAYAGGGDDGGIQELFCDAGKAMTGIVTGSGDDDDDDGVIDLICEAQIEGPPGTPGADGVDGTPGATGMTGMTGMDGEDADPQDIIDLQNRVAFLELLHANLPPIVDLGPDQTNQGEIGGPRIFQCAGDDAFNLGSGISDDGLIEPLTVTWTLNSASGFLWSVDGIVVLPGESIEATNPVIIFQGAPGGGQTSNWTVSVFDGQYTTEGTINLTCTT